MSALKESKPPRSLLKLQHWFANQIRQPLHEKLKKEDRAKCADLIYPNAFLQPHERMEIYRQQYWWRLLKIMHENFPFVTRLFGYERFNSQLGIPYLSQEPPIHWALCRLGETFPLWVEKNYFLKDRELVCQAASIDWAFGKAFWIPESTPFDYSTLTSQEASAKKLTLRASIQLFDLRADFFSFRTALLEKDVDHWGNHPFPLLCTEHSCFILFRSLQNQIYWQPISLAEYKMLAYFKEGLTINDACGKIEEEGGEFYEQAKILMPLWFRNWTINGWLADFEAQTNT